MGGVTYTEKLKTIGGLIAVCFGIFAVTSLSLSLIHI